MNFESLTQLKKEKDFVILAHYYVDGEIQEMADYVGDSFSLAKKATELKEENIIMAGVYFMGESVKILNPEKHVYVGDMDADCPMAHMVTVEKIKETREAYDDLAVVCYVNSTAEIKAHSDYCCTSSNATKVVQAIPEKNIFFIPDQNLGKNIAPNFPKKNFIFNDGYCPVHHVITVEQVEKLKSAYPKAKVLAHPECRPEVLELVDYKGSTSGILDAVETLGGEEFIILTENGIEWELRERFPNKTFIFNEMICEDMKKVKKEELIRIMEEGGEEVEISEEIREKAYIPLKRMLEICKK
ncbi:quinolinate synthase NadA [Peptoniphilus sp. KCTC 25270]|uniref:quinolinate synthase NadA n=1 Tax=Peptoniphilus sp. KCTC 25270 TaxID=2897414 RepID=UPI001E511B5B|nr:quinolinate synthase NadA [Peptoniphilus sp. KCTC 25270]MCD1146669.1 quinolinate synthase NadA [Peptoniphilus sp. KCTC 25270]